MRGGLVPRIDPDWWTAGSFEGQPMSEILAARDFGKVFAFLRQRGWSVGALSAATQIDEYRIREIIKGKRQIAVYEVIERVVVGLRIERHLCGIGVEPAVAGCDAAGGVGSLRDWLDRARVVDGEAVATLAEQTDHIRRIDAALAHALAQQAYVLVEVGRHDEARELAEHAVIVAGTAVPAVLAAWLQAVAGEIAAVDGDATACWRHFDHAATMLPGNAADPAVPYIMLDEFHLARWRGSAFARMGDGLAIAQLQYALVGMDRSFVRARAQLHVELAHAFIAAHYVDEARRELAEARALAVRVGSSRQRRRVSDLELRLKHAGV